MKWLYLAALSELYLIQRVALVVVLVRQAVARVGADKRATRVRVAHRADVGGGRRVGWSCQIQKREQFNINTKTKCYIGPIYIYFSSSSVHSHVPEMAPKTSLCKLVSRKVLDLGGVIKALVRSESSLPFWGEKNSLIDTKPHAKQGCM